MDKVKMFQESKEKLLRINKIYEQTLQTGKMSKLDYDLLIEHTKEFYESIVAFDQSKASQMFIPPAQEVKKIYLDDQITNEKETERQQSQPLLAEKNATLSIDNSATVATADAPATQSIELNDVPNIKENEEVKSEEIYTNQTIETPVEKSFFSPKIASIFKDLNTDNETKYTEQPIEKASNNDANTAITAGKENQTPLNDFNQTYAQKMSLHQSHKKDLLKMIGFNEKYIFLTELFNGNAVVYLETMNQLNSCQTYSSSFQKINELKSIHNWANDNEGLIYLNKLIELQYS